MKKNPSHELKEQCLPVVILKDLEDQLCSSMESIKARSSKSIVETSQVQNLMITN